MIGETLSHYKILDKLGAGGMGEVYLAEDNHLLRNVALKILPQKLVSDKNNQKRFIKEAQTASSLNHPNICIIHDINESENYNFIVMEYIDGQTLREIINERGPLKEDEVVEIAAKICEGMDYAHDRRWGDGNGYSHVRAALLGPGLSVPLKGGEMLLGTWQQIVLVECDLRPRSRRVVLSFVGHADGEA